VNEFCETCEEIESCDLDSPEECIKYWHWYYKYWAFEYGY